MKKWLASAALMLMTVVAAPAFSSDEVLKLDWIDLIPENERNLFDQQGMPMPDHNGSAPAKQSKIGHVRSELNGSTVKIPGFVIPLEGMKIPSRNFYWCRILVPAFMCHHRHRIRLFT